MSPIKEISDIRRLPLLGKIKLGIKREGKGTTYTEATDYFVVPDEVKAVYGEKPRELKIMFPSDDINQIASQSLKCYTYSQGLVCQGDGAKCIRKVDTKTGDFAGHETKTWALTGDLSCEPDRCPMVPRKQCRRLMSVLFILYEVPGLGVYRLNTTSFYSIVNMNSQLAPDGFLRKFTKGRIAFIPLVLYMKEQVVFPQGKGRLTVWVIDVRADVKLADIIQISRQSPAQVLLPTMDEDEAPDDLYPGEMLAVVEVAAGDESHDISHDATQDVSHDEPQPEPAAAAPRKKKPAREPAPAVITPAASAEVIEKVFIEPPAGKEAHERNVDWDWVYETFNIIKWSEGTCKSWISSTLNVNTNGDLKEIIVQLPQDKAEQLFDELRRRRDNTTNPNIQSGMFG